MEEYLAVSIHVQRVEGIAESLVKVKQQVHVPGLAPADTVVDVCKTIFDGIAFLVLDPIVINGKTNMVKSHGGDPLYVRFGDEGVEMRVCGGDALGEPAAQIDAELKAGKDSHGESPFLFDIILKV